MNEDITSLLLFVLFFIGVPVLVFCAFRGFVRWIGRQIGTRKD